MQWPNYLLLGISENYAEAVSYAVLKYGDYMIKQTDMFVDRSPAMFKEYWPKDLPSKEVLAKRRGF